MKCPARLIDELDSRSVRIDGESGVARVRPGARIPRQLRRKVPWRTEAPRQRVVDAVNDVIDKDVIVPVEEDLNAVVLHELMHNALLADACGAGAPATV